MLRFHISLRLHYTWKGYNLKNLVSIFSCKQLEDDFNCWNVLITYFAHAVTIEIFYYSDSSINSTHRPIILLPMLIDEYPYSSVLDMRISYDCYTTHMTDYATCYCRKRIKDAIIHVRDSAHQQATTYTAGPKKLVGLNFDRHHFLTYCTKFPSTNKKFKAEGSM